MDLRPATDGDGWEPAFPEGVSFLLLADPPKGQCKWGVYEYHPEDLDSPWKPKHPVSAELDALLCSATRYPPTMALARDDMSRSFNEREPSKAEFEAAYVEALCRRLGEQRTARFVFARALGGDGIDLVPGEWFWVLGPTRSDPTTVRWVSNDYFVYVNPASDFELP